MADYEFLTEATLGDYVRAHPELAGRIDPDNLVKVHEVGDGNLNLVFLARDDQGRGMCLKQALPYVRMTGEGWPLTPDRARHEVEALQVYHELAPGLVPEIYRYDESRHVTVMEDLSDHMVWRGALNQGWQHDGAAEAMGRLVGAVAFGTSVFAMDREALAEAIAESVNPQLCQITEDLVFTEPLVDAGRNSVLPANEPDARAFQADPVMMAEMGLAKWIFMTHAEALIHGDLHTGSVMVRCTAGESGPAGGDGTAVAPGRCQADSVKAFDPEFAFYGPVAFDLGALFANYVIAAARAYALREDDRARWCLALIGRTWEAFEAEFRHRWPTRTDPRVWGDATLEGLLATWKSESWLFAAAKMSRRIIGVAKTTDIETLPEDVREGAARGVLLVSRRMVSERHTDATPARLEALAAELLESTRT